MKRLFSLLISLSLAFITLFSFSTANIAFADEEESGAPSVADRIYFTDGVHEINATPVETEDYIVKNGSFEYQVVLPAIQTAKEASAFSEFKILLKRAIGNVPISVISDGDIAEFNPEAKYISIGKTTLLDKANVEYDDEQLYQNGLLIKTVGKSIFIYGGYGNGTINAVYKFFNLAFNYEQFTKNCLVIDTNVKNLKLIDFDVLDLPDIQFCSGTYGPTASYRTPVDADYKALLTGDMTREDVTNEIYMAAQRLKFQSDVNHNLLNLVYGNWNGHTSGSNHATMIVFSEPNKAKPGNENIEIRKDLWYSDSHQLCYTAHGNPEEVVNMQRFGANYFISKMKDNNTIAYPNAEFYPFGNMDGSGYCECDYCRASMAENNGTYAAANVEFVNGMCDMIVEAMEESLNDGDDSNDAWVRPNFKIMIFAYDRTRVAPAEYDEELGKYVALNGLTVSDHICVWITGYPMARYSNYDPRYNSKMASVQAWGDIAPHLESWNYGENYLRKGVFFDSLNGFSTERAQHMAALGFKWNFTEIQSNYEVVSTWHNLQYYIIGQQTWDSVYDAEELINKFFDAYFGAASETMKELYYNQRIHGMHMQEQYWRNSNIMLGVGHTMWTAADYPFELIRSWISLIDKALVDIEPYKNIDMNLYETYKDRINVEAMQFYYLVFKIHAGSQPYTLEEKQRYIESALDITTRFKNAYFDEATLRNWAKN